MCVYARSPVGAAVVQPAVCVPSCCASNSMALAGQPANRLPNLVLARKGANADFRSPRQLFEGDEAAGRQPG